MERHLITTHDDKSFRKGACHAAAWLLEMGRQLTSQGRTPEEVCEYLADLAGVVEEWRHQTNELPDGNPWDWSFKDLASVIKARRGN